MSAFINYFANLSAKNKQRIKCFIMFCMGCFSSNVITYFVASKLTGLNFIQLFTQIIIKFKQSKYAKKQIAFNQWKKRFPKSPTIPSNELLNMWDLYKEGQLFNLTRLNNNHSKLVSNLRLALKITAKTIIIHPSFVPKPKTIKSPSFKAIEIHYPGCSAENGVILYIHGGGFIGDVYEYGLPMLYQLMAKTGCIGMAIDYKVSPEHTVLDAVNDCLNCYKYIRNSYETENIFLIGDSAGGCLALLLVQALCKKEYKLPQPTGAVLLSPVCDLSCSHPSFVDNKEYEPMLQQCGLNAGYQMGLGNIDMNGNSTGKNTDAKNALYSPLYASFKGVCPLYFSTGVHEILFDESVETMKKAKAAGVEVVYEWHVSLMHCTALWCYSIPEAADALCNIAVWVNEIKKKKRV